MRCVCVIHFKNANICILPALCAALTEWLTLSCQVITFTSEPQSISKVLLLPLAVVPKSESKEWMFQGVCECTWRKEQLFNVVIITLLEERCKIIYGVNQGLLKTLVV